MNTVWIQCSRSGGFRDNLYPCWHVNHKGLIMHKDLVKCSLFLPFYFFVVLPLGPHIWTHTGMYSRQGDSHKHVMHWHCLSIALGLMVRHSLPPAEQAWLSHSFTTTTIDLLIIFFTENPSTGKQSPLFYSILFYINTHFVISKANVLPLLSKETSEHSNTALLCQWRTGFSPVCAWCSVLTLSSCFQSHHMILVVIWSNRPDPKWAP